MKESLIALKSYSFAVKVVREYLKLKGEQNEFVISKQFVRSGTSIGANVHEALSAFSKRDFVFKLSIAAKEARETTYWLKILNEVKLIKEDQYLLLSKECQELSKILDSIILTTKERYLS